jgi:hypothetical protein
MRKVSYLIRASAIVGGVRSAAEHKLCETWDRLVLLFIARPIEGWEPEFEEITRREIERLAIPVEEQGHDV